MKRKTGTVCMILGAVLVGLALSLFLYNQWDAKRAEKESHEVLLQLLAQLGERFEDQQEQNSMEGNTNWNNGWETWAGGMDIDREMTVQTVDGHEYIGYLSFPSLKRNLPVMSEWSYEGLKIAPGRYSGSVFKDNLVIAGHNYASHFSQIKWLEYGTEIDFTDMDGVTWKYEVVEIEEIKPEQTGKMTEKTEGDDWDLTLFTCTTGGQSRCAVRCVRVK